ncbi:hypothetical protein APHAL10511_002879 [Amanita phalloides]|nr:hypothetical protein APHAL10511_002879 [Amanita phalloides]
MNINSSDNKPTGSPRQQRVQRSRTPASAQPHPNVGMSPVSRYNHNLKVLRRRDPSIISIFDQFSHVCVYHHNGTKWEKQGFEGSMFLYERDAYPPYGFYILNRMGMDDYIQRLYPEDDISAHASYLMIRSYPDFTAERLNAINSSSHDAVPDKFSDVYIVPDLDKLGYNDKGRSQIVGLWMFTTSARESIIDVMLRLHSYIKKNVSYPEEFRYGPGKPPPPNPSKSTSSRKSNRVDTSPTKSVQSYESTSENESVNSYEDVRSSPPDGLSDLDKLFMKLQSPSASSSVSTTPNVISSAIPPVSQSTSKMTVDSLFAALSGSDSTQPTTSVQPSTLTTNAKATSLLNTIFASATPTSNMNASPNNIYSPTPSLKASSTPQVLSQDVLSNLLGLPPSRSASVVSASSTYSSNAPSQHSIHSHSSSREGDDEDESDLGGNDAESLFTSPNTKRRSRQNGTRNGLYTSDGSFSESSTVLDAEPGLNPDQLAAGPSGRRQSLAQTAEGFLRASVRTVQGRPSYDHGDVNGDVTPRPPIFLNPTNVHSSLLRMSSTSKLQGATRIQRGEKADGRASVPPTAPPVELSLSTSTVRAAPSSTRAYQGDSKQDATESGKNGPKHRPLVPFSADSELWPYPHRSGSWDSNAIGNENEDDGEILELDFEETSALSDMDAFRRALQMGKEKSRATSAGGSAGSGAEGHDLNGSLKGRKKTKKEMQAEKREQIENAWDMPTPIPNPPPSLHGAQSQTPSRKEKEVNGTHQPQVNKQSAVNGNLAGSVDAGLVKDSLVGTLLNHSQKLGILERNAFVREVLTLIHTDKTFVDTLWKDYMDKLDT